MSLNHTWRYKAAVLGLAASIALTAGGVGRTSEVYAASVPKLESIRVALLLDNGKWKNSLPAVTISTDKGVALSLGTSGGNESARWPVPSGLTRLRASLDQFTLKLLDTGDFAKARALRDRLKELGQEVSIISRVRQGKAAFEVIIGPYPTRETAMTASNALTQQPTLVPLMDKPAVQGSLRWSAGTFATEEEAMKHRAALAQAGVDGDLAVTEKAAGVYQYSVWVGNEADPAGWNALKAAAVKAMPALQLSAADLTKPYLLKRDDLTASQTGTGSTPHYTIAASGTKLRIHPVEGRVTVAEKSDRAYRGSLELTSYNGKLALINELPFEHYLYSVVTGEMGQGWPAEALKAQAVAARTYALKAGLKYEIAHVSDSTLDQVYDGKEAGDVVKAVDATQGEVLVNKDGLITAFFSANAGGMTSTGEDVWGTALPYLKSVPSPDEGPSKGKLAWKRIVLSDGREAFVRSDYVKMTSANNPAGLPYYEFTDNDVNVRAAPYVDNLKNPPLAKFSRGERVVVIGEESESNSYSWVRGPYKPDELLQKMNSVLSEPIPGRLDRLQVTKRGASGRVTEITANGKPIKVSTPDAYRSVLNGLPSTRFEIEQSGRYTILGANGVSVETGGSSAPLYARSGGGESAVGLGSSSFYVMDGQGKVKLTTKEERYTIKGTGYGHGVGLSQWGARGWAELGYDYRKILQYYYEGVTLTKD